MVLLKPRKSHMREEDARLLVDNMSKWLHELLSQLFTPVRFITAAFDLDDADEDTKTIYRRSKQALLIQTSKMFDLNECNITTLRRQRQISEAYIQRGASELKIPLKDEFYFTIP